MRRHGELLADLMGEPRGLRDFRKHVPWYLKGFPAGGELRAALGMVESLAQLDELLAQLDPTMPVPRRANSVPPVAARAAPATTSSYPQGWLDDTDGLTTDLADAELGVSGG